MFKSIGNVICLIQIGRFNTTFISLVDVIVDFRKTFFRISVWIVFAIEAAIIWFTWNGLFLVGFSQAICKIFATKTTASTNHFEKTCHKCDFFSNFFQKKLNFFFENIYIVAIAMLFVYDKHRTQLINTHSVWQYICNWCWPHGFNVKCQSVIPTTMYIIFKTELFEPVNCANG